MQFSLSLTQDRCMPGAHLSAKAITPSSFFPTFVQNDMIVREEDEEEGGEKQLDSIFLQLHAV